ncbi:helix-turn-helix domain-containing protein [Chitinophaga silvatica]|uniref:Helix-turn-helix domain-containing protein n=1 Tax=Chitinophaga silvatica TaxID=2282649 RepID=A0A3E1YH43_9BACT|nr:AraC family transcriptional regulator [Chitinophaga silvatica]RFS26745.1 helix-turn-helix domain-containing protein [Chitinophaga silvatica]
MKTVEIPVFSLEKSNATTDACWLGEINDLLRNGPVRLECHLLVFITSGSLNVVIDGTSISLQKGELIYVRSGSIVKITISPDAAGTCVCFTEAFMFGKYDRVLTDYAVFQRSYFHVDQYKDKQYARYESLLVLMKAEFHEQQANTGSVLRSFLNILLCKLDREILDDHKIYQQRIPKEKIREFKYLLEKYFATHRSASFYASNLNITTNYLNKLCQNQEGMSCGDMIRRRIIVEAQRLLRYTALSVIEIAQQLEFESSSYFITFFKRNVGITPERFRKNNKK